MRYICTFPVLLSMFSSLVSLSEVGILFIILEHLRPTAKWPMMRSGLSMARYVRDASFLSVGIDHSPSSVQVYSGSFPGTSYL